MGGKKKGGYCQEVPRREGNNRMGDRRRDSNSHIRKGENVLVKREKGGSSKTGRPLGFKKEGPIALNRLQKGGNWRFEK